MLLHTLVPPAEGAVKKEETREIKSFKIKKNAQNMVYNGWSLYPK